MRLTPLQKQNHEMKSAREHPRNPISLKVIFETGALLSMQKYHQGKANWDTRNLCEGGLCLITDRALKESQIIKIRLPIPNVHATTPTLAEVRWVKRQAAARQSFAKQNGSHRYIAGLRFLV
jgi:hypothetical protein